MWPCKKWENCSQRQAAPLFIQRTAQRSACTSSKNKQSAHRIMSKLQKTRKEGVRRQRARPRWTLDPSVAQHARPVGENGAAVVRACPVELGSREARVADVIGVAAHGVLQAPHGLDVAVRQHHTVRLGWGEWMGERTVKMNGWARARANAALLSLGCERGQCAPAGRGVV